jgi:hypothetical protein
VLVACALAAAAFAYRFNTLGGTLGGFDDDEFAHLLRTDVLLQGEQPLRDFKDSELRGAWPSLSYAVPAWAQQAWGRSLLAEAYLTAGALAVAHAITFALALQLSRGRWSVALLAALFVIATLPKLYNYPKVLTLALGAAAIRFVMAAPSWPALTFAAVVTAAAVLFRHDYGVYVATGIVAAVAVREAGEWRLVARRLAQYAALTAAILAPSAIWVQRYEGIVPYLRSSLATSGIESRRTSLGWPAFDWASPAGEDNLVALTYYVFLAVPVVAFALLVARSRSAPALPRADRGAVAGLIACAVLVDVFFLRANLTQRFGDAAIVLALLLAWMAANIDALRSRGARVAAGAAVRLVLVVLLAAAFGYTGGASELRNSGLATSLAQVRTQFGAVRDSLREQPPAAWSDDTTVRRLQASRYLAECTAPGDRVVVAAYAPEIPVFARRAFAGGQPTYSLGFYLSEEEQQGTLARLRAQSVPVVLGTEEYEDGFAADYPLLARHIAERYREAGAIPRAGNAVFRVFVEASRPVVRQHPPTGLPCYR